MQHRQSRILVGMTGLVALWIVLYWLWEPRSQREPVVRFAEPEAQVAAEETIEQPKPSQPADQPGQGFDEQRTPKPAAPSAAEASAPRQTRTPFGDPPFREIVARDGDTFQKIAERELGSARLWTSIARANPFKDPNRLKPGDRVRIPLDADNPQGWPDDAQQPAAQPAPVVEYTVQSGDSLSKIAKQFYGSVRYVDFLYESNRERLRSKDDLRVGQVLRIPPKPDGG